jgi:hypothetical protein
MIGSKKIQMNGIVNADVAAKALRFAVGPWVGRVIAIMFCGVLIPSAQASVCSDAIAQLHISARRLAHNNPVDGPSAPQSIAAQLGHQPTPLTVHDAERTAKSDFAAILARAEALDAEGKQAKCMEAVINARHLLD